MTMSKHEINLSRWEFVRFLTKEEKIKLGYYPSSSRGWYKCRNCGELKHIVVGDFKRYATVCDNGCHGKSAQPSKVIVGVDDLATTHPDLVHFFVDEKDAKKHRSRSNKKVELKCPHCGYKKQMTIDKLTSRGFSCPVCDDGFSYPERMLASLLLVLGVQYKSQFKFDNEKYRYDFYIPSLNMIIETHGRQHYEQHRRKGARTLEEEQENDRIKYEIAVANGIKHYVVIDCSDSTFSYIKQSIMSSVLKDILELDEVDWEAISTKSESSMVVDVINYYKHNNKSISEIATHFGLAKNTVRNYVSRGLEIGLCKHKEINTGKEVVAVMNGEVVEVSKTIAEMSSKYNIARTTFGRKLGGHDVFMEGNTFQFYLIDSQEWERDKHLFRMRETEQDEKGGKSHEAN